MGIEEHKATEPKMAGAISKMIDYFKKKDGYKRNSSVSDKNEFFSKTELEFS
jgi:hypothetical protein